MHVLRTKSTLKNGGISTLLWERTNALLSLSSEITSHSLSLHANLLTFGCRIIDSTMFCTTLQVFQIIQPSDEW